MGDAVEQLSTAFAMNEYFLNANLEGVTEDQALSEPAGDANDINWIVGHVTYWRSEMLKLIGTPTEGEENGWERYDGRNGRERGPGDPTPLADLAGAFGSLGASLRIALEENPDRLEVELEDGETVAARLGKLQVHESYHVGQLGVLRRALGKPGAI